MSTIKKGRLNIESPIDEQKAQILQNMFHSLTIHQLEEVEIFAKSIVKHPSKYIEFIHEN